MKYTFWDVLIMKLAAKFVPKFQKFYQKNRGMAIAQNLLNNVNNVLDLLETVTTDDETWLYGYDVETETNGSRNFNYS